MTDRELNELKRERDNWRTVACWLADIHAANAEYDAKLSATSKSRRERFADIAEKAAAMMRHGVPVGVRIHPDTTPDMVEARLNRVVESLKGGEA